MRRRPPSEALGQADFLPLRSWITSLAMSDWVGARVREGEIFGVAGRCRRTDGVKISILQEVGEIEWSVTDLAQRHDLTREHIYQCFRPQGEGALAALGSRKVQSFDLHRVGSSFNEPGRFRRLSGWRFCRSHRAAAQQPSVALRCGHR